MSDRTIERYLLATDGVNQIERSPAALSPTSVPLDGRSKSDIVLFIKAIAEQIRFYTIENQAQGDWRAFYDQLTSDRVTEAESAIDLTQPIDSSWPPHLALLMAFLQQYSFAQADLNSLTTKRLSFFYEKVLRLKRTQPIPDKVHVVFEPAKNARPTLLKSGVLLDAGLTETGKKIHYELESDSVITSSKINSLLTSYADQNLNGKQIIMKADDATTVTDPTEAWRPFGTAQLSLPEESRQMEVAQIGCAIASPALLLAEGHRTIKIDIHLLSDPGLISPDVNLRSLVDIELTGSEGWIVPDTVSKVLLTPDNPLNLSSVQENSYTLSTSVTLHQDTDAIVPYDDEVHEIHMSTDWPVYRFIVKPEAYLYELLARFVVKSIDIEVQVEGVSNLVLQNEQSVQAPGSPATPFGTAPYIGSKFYIGSGEIFGKIPTSLSINLSWKDPPEDISDYYDGYGNPNIDPEDYTMNVDLLAGKVWTTIAGNRSVFNTVDPTAQHVVTLPPSDLQATVNQSTYRRTPGLNTPVQYDSSVKQGFIRCVLTGPTATDLGNLPTDVPFEAFGHKAFTNAYTKQVINLALENPATIPQQPYTPELESVSIDYTAKHTILVTAPNGIDSFWQMDVFGAAEVDDQAAAFLVPEHPGTGGLYIGFEKSQPPLTASLLFQAVEGSAPGEELLSVEDVSWSYLAGNSWRKIATNEILEDATDGFQKPGLVRIQIGRDASLDHTLMPTQLHWLRAMVNQPEGAASLENIQAQAARATLVIADEDADEDADAYEQHLSSPLPASSVTGLVRKVSAIKGVVQPYPGFGGRPRESDTALYRRCHEQLRHRARAVTSWDFERILLERYPEVFKVKCLPHTDMHNNLTPGSVKLVVVPDWRKRPTGNPLQPKANLAFLREMTRALSADAGEFSQLEVTNPSYETLLVDAKVSFHAGFDPGFHVALLTEELKRFLSPWAFDEGKDIVFGGKLHSSEILAFMEGREYVDFIADFAVYHRYTGPAPSGIGDMQIGVDFVVGDTPEPSIGGSVGKEIGVDFVVGVPVEVAAATQPDSIIVSNDTHRIQAYQASDNICLGAQTIGIGQMIIGLDFIPVS